MLHNEATKLVLKALETTHNAKEVAKCFSVHISTVYRLKKQMDDTGSVETRTNLRGRKPSLSAEDLNRIDALVQNQFDITLQEIIDTLQLKVNNDIVRKAVVKLGYIFNATLSRFAKHNLINSTFNGSGS
ncbi:MAG: transcriptional regulator [Faecalibacterium sp.]